MTTMVPPPAAGALDVRTFLLGDLGPQALRERLDELISQPGLEGLEAIGKPVRKALGEELADMAAGFLDVDLGTTAMAGWRKHQDLLRAARETQATPGSTQRLSLAEHTITWTARPRIQVELGGAPLAKLVLEVEVSFTLVGLQATVTAGRLARLSGGSGTVTASLSFGGHPLTQRTAPFDAGAGISLGQGVPLLGVPEPRQTPDVVESDRGDRKAADRAAADRLA